jgi:hypothetical protein
MVSCLLDYDQTQAQLYSAAEEDLPDTECHCDYSYHVGCSEEMPIEVLNHAGKFTEYFLII